MSEPKLTRLMRMTARTEMLRRRRYLTRPPRLIPPRIVSQPVSEGDIQPGSEPMVFAFSVSPPLRTDFGGDPVVPSDITMTAEWTDNDDRILVGEIGKPRPDFTEALDPFTNFDPGT